MPGEHPRKKANLMQKYNSFKYYAPSVMSRLRRHDADAFAKVLRYVESESKMDRRMFGPNRIRIPSVIVPSPVRETPKSVSTIAHSPPLASSPLRPNLSKLPQAVESKSVSPVKKSVSPVARNLSPEVEMLSVAKETTRSEPPLVIPASPVAEAEMDAMMESPMKPKMLPPMVTEATMQLGHDSVPTSDALLVDVHPSQLNALESQQQPMTVAMTTTGDPMTTAMMMDVPETQSHIQHQPQLQHQPPPQPHPQPQLQQQPQPQPHPQQQPQPQPHPQPQPFPAPQAAIQGRRIRRVSRTKRTDEMAQDEPMQSTSSIQEPRLSASSFGSVPSQLDGSPGGNPFSATAFGATQTRPFQPSPPSGSGFFGSFTTPSTNFGTPTSSFGSFQATPSTFQTTPSAFQTPSSFQSQPHGGTQQQPFGHPFNASPQGSSFGAHPAQSPPSPTFGAQPIQSPPSPSFGAHPAQSPPSPTFGAQPVQNPQMSTFGSQLFQSPIRPPPAFGQQPNQSPIRPPPAFGQQPNQSPIRPPPAFGQHPNQSPVRPPSFGHQPPPFGQQAGQSPASDFGGQPMDSTEAPAFGSQPPAFGVRPAQPTPSDQPFMANAQVSFSFGRLSTPARRTRQHGRRRTRN